MKETKRKDWINLSRSTNEMKMRQSDSYRIENGFQFENLSRPADETKRPSNAPIAIGGAFVKNKTKGARYFNAALDE